MSTSLWRLRINDDVNILCLRTSSALTSSALRNTLALPMSHPNTVLADAEKEIQRRELQTANCEPLPSGYFALVPLNSNYGEEQLRPSSKSAPSYPPSETTTEAAGTSNEASNWIANQIAESSCAEGN